MKIAIQEAQASLREGHHGFGAVIVKENGVITRAHDTEETDADPTAHAEMNAIRNACALLGKNLSSCTLVCTHEPCPMCAAAIVWAQISRVAFGYDIADAIAQGRTRIEISCEEVFQRANAGIAVERGVLKEECSILCDREVRAEMKRLRGASDDQLRAYDDERAAKRIAWFEKEHDTAPVGDLLDKAYSVLLRKLGIREDEAPVVRRDDRAIMFHSKNFCPTLEACQILGMDTRRVCRLSNDKSTNAVVRQVDRRLNFTRNYERIRPHSEYCEESISYRGDAGKA